MMKVKKLTALVLSLLLTVSATMAAAIRRPAAIPQEALTQLKRKKRRSRPNPSN